MNDRFLEMIAQAIKLTNKYYLLQAKDWRMLFENRVARMRACKRSRRRKKLRDEASRYFLAARYLEGSVDSQGFTHGRKETATIVQE